MKQSKRTRCWLTSAEAGIPGLSIWGEMMMTLLTSLTDEGNKTIKEWRKRIKEVNKEAEAMGVTVMAQYPVPGFYDFANVVEAPDIGAITRLTVELGSRGTMQVMCMIHRLCFNQDPLLRLCLEVV